MFGNFETHMTSIASFTEEELDHIRSLSIERKIRRRQSLLSEGEVCRYKIFVSKGLLRNYLVREEGTEHILRFTAENGWTTDPESYDTGAPSKYHIDALEDSEVRLWSHENLQLLVAAIPTLKILFERIKSIALHDVHNRIVMHVSYTAEEKYQAFIASMPDVFSRVPLHMVASYLGVSTKTLTRIRHGKGVGVGG